MSEIFYCKNCGGIMEFDAATQSLKCPHCGEEQKIDANRSAVREHKLTAEARQMVRVRSEEHTSELQSLPPISYAVFCLKKIFF